MRPSGVVCVDEWRRILQVMSSKNFKPEEDARRLVRDRLYLRRRFELLLTVKSKWRGRMSSAEALKDLDRVFDVAWFNAERLEDALRNV
jgi:hypothetical protein